MQLRGGYRARDMYTGLIGPRPRPRPSDKMDVSIHSRRSVVTCCGRDTGGHVGIVRCRTGSALHVPQSELCPPLNFETTSLASVPESRRLEVGFALPAQVRGILAGKAERISHTASPVLVARRSSYSRGETYLCCAIWTLGPQYLQLTGHNQCETARI